jgi:hypothetical protein
MPHGMHEQADHCCVDQSTDRECAEEDHRAEPARDQTGDPRGEQGTRKRNQDQPNAGEIGVIAPDLENHEPPTTTTATSNRYALTNQLPNRNPKTFIAVRSGG